ncbi:MAG: hypothetical protein DKM23_02490 [Candidatus Melainabacteria bacterium]|nr:MAG: hypothetical protein DKM23_02490 [Candidatus Melainabacteria bacterium]
MKKLALTLGYLSLIIISLSMLFPFFAMLNLSLTPSNEIFNSSGVFFHTNLTLENFRHVFKELPITRYFANSMIVALLTTLGQVIISALAGYAFARLNFKYKNFWFFVILVTMMVPPQVNIIPLFFLMRELHLVNTFPALILPGLFGGFGVFLMRQYFLSLPKDLEEAAKIDGCNIFQTFFKIGLPLALPAVVTLTIFTFVTTWNSFMWPLIITNSESMRTLPVGLAIFKGNFREITMWGDLLACSVICTIPVIAIFFLGKKYFLSDLLSGAIKE